MSPVFVVKRTKDDVIGRLEGTSATQDECNTKDAHVCASIHNERKKPQQ
jgi:hypothetical protein